MRIGAPKEIKNNEYRVGLTPNSVSELTRLGHEVLIEQGAGLGAGFDDAAYEIGGARILQRALEIFAQSEMIVKVKEPQPEEIKLLRPDQLLFTYLHLAADAKLTASLIASGAHCIAYETVSAADGSLPLLAPMSEIAGRLAPQMGARFLEKEIGGRGVLLAGAPGVPSAHVLVLGAGSVGVQATEIALGMGARVSVIDRNIDALRRVSARFGARIQTVASTNQSIQSLLPEADLVICAALIAGAKAPILITRDMLTKMAPGSVIVDVAIDQGGCCETSRPTTHKDPVYTVDNVIHYCVANMPGVVPRTSTLALNNATLPVIVRLAEKGWRAAVAADVHLRSGLEITNGRLVSAQVAKAHGMALCDSNKL